MLFGVHRINHRSLKLYLFSSIQNQTNNKYIRKNTKMNRIDKGMDGGGATDFDLSGKDGK